MSTASSQPILAHELGLWALWFRHQTENPLRGRGALRLPLTIRCAPYPEDCPCRFLGLSAQKNNEYCQCPAVPFSEVDGETTNTGSNKPHTYFQQESVRSDCPLATCRKQMTQAPPRIPYTLCPWLDQQAA